MPGPAEILKDDENKYADTTAGYPSSDIAAANDDQGATISDVKRTVDKTQPIAGRNRRFVQTLDFVAIAADQLALLPINGRVLLGWQIQETSEAGAVANVILRKGQNASPGESKQIVNVKLTSKTNDKAWYGTDGLDISEGLFIDMVAGTVDISIYFAHE